MFGWEFPPHNSGGLGTACLGLTRALSLRGVEVIFVLPKTLDVSSEYARMVFADKGKEVAFKYVDSILYPYVTSNKYGNLYNKTRNSIYGPTLLDEVRRYALLAREIAEEEDFDVIHAHDWLSFLAGIEAKKVSGKPLILHVHATEFDRGGGQGINPDVYKIEKESLKYADKVIAVSNFTKNKLVKHYDTPAEKIEVVYNGADCFDHKEMPSKLEKLREAGNRIVLFAGRLTLQKGPEYFLRAAKRVLDVDENVVFVIAGSGDMEHQMMDEAASLGISDKIIFAGFLRGAELDSVYQEADLHVVPSVSEPFGIMPLEAIANGTPVIVSKQSGVSEVLTHVLKTDFWDTEDIANKILSALRYDSLHKTLLDNSSDEIKGLTWDKSANKCIQLYETVTRKKRNVW